MLGVANDKLRVFTDDVGGAFGMKTPVYPEYLAVLVAAKKIGRPVHWMSTRSEAFMTDTQARDTYTETELALDDKGKFLALRMKHFCGQGAYITPAGVSINTNNVARCLPGMYRIPKIDFSACSCSPIRRRSAPIAAPDARKPITRSTAWSKKPPASPASTPCSCAGRTSSRPRRCLTKPRSATTYDSGDFPAIFAKALELSDYKNFAKRKRESARRKKLRGIGISCMLEHAGALPTESAR